MSGTALAAAERTARESYGRLLSRLASRSRDIAAAEDALSEAFAQALVQWPRDGVPENPEGWLVHAARRRLEDGWRRTDVRTREEDALKASLPQSAELDVSALPDERLRLLFVCAHPAIDRSVQSALMLQTVLGLDADTIASSFLVAPKTLGQRLWRAKTKIREAGIAFEVPEGPELTERLGAVLEAIYAAFGTGWEDVVRGGKTSGLVDEAIFLARLLVTAMPDEPEPKGLLALMLFADARRAARRSPSGDFVPLEQQDTALWNGAFLAEADRLLSDAFQKHRPGTWQIEAAIQSAHVQGGLTGRRDVRALVDLYDGLVHFAPSLGALVGRAAAVLEAFGPEQALTALDELEAPDYQPYWVVRALVLERLGRHDDAHAARERAIGLTEDEAVRRHLIGQRPVLSEPVED